MTTSNYRALCAELLAELENAIRVIYHEDGTHHISAADAVIASADTALAEPEPPKGCAVDPIPLSERKPRLEDRDHYGQCWWWDTSCTHRPAWVYAVGWGTHWLPASTECLPAKIEGASDAKTVEPAPPADGELGS